MQREHRISTPPRVEDVTSALGQARKGFMEADGTRYTALVIDVGVTKRFQLQMLGAVDEGYLVVCGLNRVAYLFQKQGYLAVSYLMEKFRLNECDAENFATLLKELMPTRTF